MPAGRPPVRRYNSRHTSPLAPRRLLPGIAELLGRYGPALLWGLAALLVTLLGLRFFLRLLGVRDDLAFPAFIYGVTLPLVSPFYGPFPVSSRLDHPAVEAASLAAGGVALVVALVVYVVWLLVRSMRGGQR